MCLMMVLGGANVWAQETKSVTCTLEKNASSSTFDPIESSFDLSYSRAAENKNKNGVYWDCNKGEVTISAKLKDENSTITKIVANSKCAKTTPKLTVSVGNVQFGKTVSLTTTNKDYTFEGQASGEVKLHFTGKASSKPGSYFLKTITIYYTESTSGTKTLKSLAISGQPTKTTYNVGEEFDPTGLVVTGTYDDNTTGTITNGITWTKNPKTLSLGDVACSVTASVGEVKSESYVVNGLNVVRTISLSIDPTTSTVVKAPVNVTLTATEGATVYYTTNGDEPTTSSTKYTTPFDVTVSGTTVKALAVAEGAENVTAVATYTIKPDQPVFSDESKTFKDAFDVTLTLPESTDATSKIYYKIGGTATAESTPYEGPITISAEKDGEKVTLHAVVVDEYGNVGKEKYCTYTKSNAIVFDFAANPNAWGITPLGKNGKTESNVIAGKELEVDGVVMTATNGSSQGTCIYKTSAGDVSLKVYKDATITFTAPVGYNISEILFDGQRLGNLSSEEETYTAPSWTGNAPSVQFSNSSKAVDIYTASIKLVAAEPVKPIFGTLDFKAHDGDGFYYATFSSDKDVVFNQENVYVNGVSVSNGKVSMEELTLASYNVTDATVGSIENGYYVPANTGVLIVGFDATTTYYFPAEAQTVTLLANQLKPAPANGGVFEATAGYKYYKLAYDDFDNQTGLGFYWGAPEGGKFFVKAGTAYLAVPAGEATAKGFAFNGEATGIEGVNANVENAKAIYNLNGQRVASMAKPGLYIVNGKKMVVRK